MCLVYVIPNCYLPLNGATAYHNAHVKCSAKNSDNPAYLIYRLEAQVFRGFYNKVVINQTLQFNRYAYKVFDSRRNIGIGEILKDE